MDIEFSATYVIWGVLAVLALVWLRVATKHMGRNSYGSWTDGAIIFWVLFGITCLALTIWIIVDLVNPDVTQKYLDARMCKEWQVVYQQLNVIDDQDERFEYFKIAVEKVNSNLSPEGSKLITGSLSWATEPSLSRDRKKAVEEIMRPVMLRSLENKNEH